MPHKIHLYLIIYIAKPLFCHSPQCYHCLFIIFFSISQEEEEEECEEETEEEKKTEAQNEMNRPKLKSSHNSGWHKTSKFYRILFELGMSSEQGKNQTSKLTKVKN